jgi:peptidoglycan-N-acetylglucosamine deacetylase
VPPSWMSSNSKVSRSLSRLLLATSVAAMGLFGSPVRAQVASKPQLAITFDDLPAHGPLPIGETRLEIASKILKAMQDAKLPPISGFVNGVAITNNPTEAAVLDAWRTAGNPLGNHGWSHLNLNQTPLSDFEQDVTQNEPVLIERMKDADWHWFRYPFLAEGDGAEKRIGFREFLAQHGYKIAAVTMSFADYEWNEPYARCKARGDVAAIAELGESYLKAADQSADYYRSLSKTLFGRDIPYVLLMHIGSFDAEMLPKLLSLYKSKGFQFVTLEKAEHDPFYRSSIDPHLAQPDSLEGAMAERHLQLPPRPLPAVAPAEVCR